MKERIDIFGNFNKECTIHEIEEACEKLSLWFETAVAEQVRKLEEKEKLINRKIDELDSQLTGSTDESGLPISRDSTIYNEIGGLLNERYEIGEQLGSIWEMVFINLYKLHNPVLSGTHSCKYPAGDSCAIRHPFLSLSGSFLG